MKLIDYFIFNKKKVLNYFKFNIDKIFEFILSIIILILVTMLILTLISGIFLSKPTGKVEIIGKEIVPEHVEKGTKLTPVIIGGSVTNIVTPTSDHNEETFVLHVRKKSDNGFDRYLLETNEDTFNSYEIGETINSEEFDEYSE